MALDRLRVRLNIILLYMKQFNAYRAALCMVKIASSTVFDWSTLVTVGVLSRAKKQTRCFRLLNLLDHCLVSWRQWRVRPYQCCDRRRAANPRSTASDDAGRNWLRCWSSDSTGPWRHGSCFRVDGTAGLGVTMNLFFSCAYTIAIALTQNTGDATGLGRQASTIAFAKSQRGQHDVMPQTHCWWAWPKPIFRVTWFRPIIAAHSVMPSHPPPSGFSLPRCHNKSSQLCPLYFKTCCRQAACPCGLSCLSSWEFLLPPARARVVCVLTGDFLILEVLTFHTKIIPRA